MGFKDLIAKVQEQIKKNPDKIKQGLKKAEGLADKQTGGKYHNQISKADQKAGEYIDKQGGGQPQR